MTTIPISINNPKIAKVIPSLLLPMFDVRFGYIEHDTAKTKIDKLSKTFVASSSYSAPIVEEVSLKRFFRPISNQYHLNSCVANATADTVEAEIARTQNISPAYVSDMSRLFIYYNARNIMPDPSADIDKGSYVSLAFDCLTRYGVPKESSWPYNFEQVNERPPVLVYREALSNKFSKYYSINSDGDSRILDCIRALSASHPIVFGTSVTADFIKFKGESVVQLPNGGFIGAHAMVIVGWSSSKKAFEIRNSWGTDWGNYGYCWMAPEYIKANITKDLWVL